MSRHVFFHIHTLHLHLHPRACEPHKWVLSRPARRSPSGLFFNPASLYRCGRLTYRPCGRLPFHWKKKGLSGRFSGNKNDFVMAVAKTNLVEYLFSSVSLDLVWNQPSPCLLCESSPLIFLVYGAPRVSWTGVEKGDITAFRQIPYERKKERLQLSSIKQWKHYKVIGSD